MWFCNDVVRFIVEIPLNAFGYGEKQLERAKLLALTSDDRCAQCKKKKSGKKKVKNFIFDWMSINQLPGKENVSYVKLN